MERDLLSDLRRLDIEDRPKDLPPELEAICASVERKAVDARKIERESGANSPEYISAESALRIAVDDLKEYRTEAGWDTAKFLSDHPPEAPQCTGYPCRPWDLGRTSDDGAAGFRCPVIGEYESPVKTGVEGVNRDRWEQGWRDSEAYMLTGHLCDEELFRGINFEKHNHPQATGVVGVNRDMPPYSAETHFRPSSVDPFGEGGDAVQRDNPEQMKRVREALKDCNLDDIKDNTPGSAEIE